MKISPNTPSKGFTLIELLTVIAIIGILAAIIIPTTGSVRTSANKAQTRSQFSNWATAMNLFKQEYGYLPDITNGNNKIDSNKFARALTGRLLNGDTISGNSATDHYGNRKKLTFYTLSDNDLNTTKTAIVDAFGNTDIAILFDRNGDGVIRGHGPLESNTSPIGVSPIGGTGTLNPSPELSTEYPIRATVIFYSAGKGDKASDIVYSWK